MNKILQIPAVLTCLLLIDHFNLEINIIISTKKKNKIAKKN